MYLLAPITAENDAILNQAASNVAITLDAKLKQEQIAHMLDESRKILQQQMAQEEEMRQNMEELTITQEEMHRVERELFAQMQALSQSMLIMQLDLDGCFLKVNERFVQLCGIDSNSITKKTIADLLIPEDTIHADWMNSIWNTVSNGHIHSDTFRLRDDANVWIEVTFAPVFNEHNKAEKILGFGQNITEKKLADQRIQQLLVSQEHSLNELRAKEEDISRLLEVTRENERQLQETEARYREYIKQLSLKIKELEKRPNFLQVGRSLSENPNLNPSNI